MDARVAPRPITQTKITRNHSDLKEIPLPLNPSSIVELYLSHNAICSVKGKLCQFSGLKNLNLSYNLLSDPF